MTCTNRNSRIRALLALLPVEPSSLGALRRTQFLYLLVQQFLSIAATYAITFASMAKVIEATGSGVQAAFTILSVVVPGLIFGLIGGVTVDRVRRRTMLILTNVLRGIIALAAPLYWDLIPPGAIFPAILAVNFLLSAVGQFNFPAEAALIPHMTTSEELTGANSAFNMSYLLAIAFGAGVLGPLSVRFLGPEWAYFCGGVLFAVSLAPLSRLEKDPPPRERVMRRSRYARLRHVASVASDVAEGISFASHNGAISVAILALVSQTALALGLAAVFPVVMSVRFGIPVYNLPLLLLPGGLGAGLGLLGLLSPVGCRRTRTTLVVVGNAVMSVGLLGLTLSIWLEEWGTWGILGSSPLIGAGFVLAYISAKSILQEVPPDYLRGRVVSLQLTLNNVVSLLPTVLAGWALDKLGDIVVFIAATAAFIYFTFLGARWVRRMASDYF